MIVTATIISLIVITLLSITSVLLALRAKKNKLPLIWDIPGCPTEVSKPWGKEVIWAVTDKYVGKVLHINAGHQLSKQYHMVKDESIFILSGRMNLELEWDKSNMTVPMNTGDCIRIPTGVIHRMIALSDCQVAEVSTPELSDVVRLEDSYGRAPSAVL